MKTVPCEFCRKGPASSLLWLGGRSHQQQPDRWKLPSNCTSRVETFYVYLGEIETLEHEQRWCEHARGKRCFEEAEFDEAVQRFQTANTNRCPAWGER